MAREMLLNERRSAGPGRPPCFHAVITRSWVPMAVILLLSAFAVPRMCRAQDGRNGVAASLSTSDLFALKARCGSAEAVKDSLQLIRKHAFGGPDFEKGDLVAFEENRLFIYAVGEASHAGSAEKAPRLVRRFIFLKPSTFVIDDRVRAAEAGKPIRWLLRTQSAPTMVDGRQVRITEADGELVCQKLLPERAILTLSRWTGGEEEPVEHFVGVAVLGDRKQTRFLHVLQVREPGDKDPVPQCKLARENGGLQLTVATEGRTFQLALPSAPDAAGTIAVSKADGQSLLDRRLLPSGIMPHGAKGAQLLERWDSAYRDNRRPGWDTGRPSSNLTKVVEDGTLRPCRAVVLGCGTGTNAIYLAAKGFDVTGIDIAPTALARAEAKARKAGVKVRWTLADVLAPPKLEPFDLVFDRGCYHGVRRQNAAGYVATVRRLSHRGTRLLILAGNANESRHYGPPRVKEAEIRGDFSSAFEFEWLRETRFDSTDPAVTGPMAWSILLRRK